MLVGGSLRTLVATAFVVALAAAGLWRRRARTAQTSSPEASPPVLASSPARRRLPWAIFPGIAVTATVWHLTHSTTYRPRLAWAIAGAFLGAVLAWEWSRRADTAEDGLSRPAEPSPIVVIALVLIAAGATVTLQRPDVDDAFYLGLAVQATDAPERPLMSENPIIGLPGTPMGRYQALRSLELLTAAASYLTGLPAIDIAHRVWPPLWAAAVVLAYARLLRLVAPERWLAATATVLSIFLTVGDTHRWYSNFAFVRLHQGKGVLVSVALPLLAAAALECARRPTRGAWLALVFLQIGAVGLSPSALWLAPCVVLPAFAAGTVLSLRSGSTRAGLLSALLAGLACAYVLVIGLRLRPYIAPWVAKNLAGISSLQILREAHELVCGTGALAFLVALSVALAWSTCASALARRFCLVFPLAFLAVLANPYLAHTIAGLGPGLETYFRIYWMLPVPVFLALCLTAPLGAWGEGWPRWSRAAAALVLVAAFVGLVPRVWVMSAENGVRLAPFALKVPPVEYAVAGMLARSAAPGSRVVAPAEIAPWVVVYHHHPDPLVVRAMYLSGAAGEVNRRIEMARFAGTADASEASRATFLAGLDNYLVSGVSFRTGAEAEPLRAALAARGFRTVGSLGGYEVWSRPPEFAPPGRFR